MVARWPQLQSNQRGSEGTPFVESQSPPMIQNVDSVFYKNCLLFTGSLFAVSVLRTRTGYIVTYYIGYMCA